MKYTYKIVDKDGGNVRLDPWDTVEVNIKAVEYLPGTNDPDDPNDEEEMILWLEVKDIDNA